MHVYVYVIYSGGYEKVSNSSQSSYYNDMEASQVVRIIGQLLAGSGGDGGGGSELELDEIGVISPYNAQVKVCICLL